MRLRSTACGAIILVGMFLHPKLPFVSLNYDLPRIHTLSELIVPSQSTASDVQGFGSFFSRDPVIESLPFDLWKSEGTCQQIPWTVKTDPLGMSFAERLVERVEIDVDGEELARRVADGRLVALVEVVDDHSNVYRNWAEFKLQRMNQDFGRNEVDIYWDAFVTPGHFRVNVALYDTATREHDFSARSLIIEPYRNDVLAGSWSGLPTVEFLAPSTGLDADYHPEISGRLHLPVSDRVPVHLRLVLNSSVSRNLARQPGAEAYYLGEMIASLKTLSELDIGAGSRDVVVLDLVRFRKSFEQTDLRPLEWLNLKTALQETDSGVIDVQSLQKRRNQATFFRQELEQGIITSADSATSACLTILLSTDMIFESHSDLTPLVAPSNDVCHFYYLRYGALAQTDDMRRILKALHPHTLDIKSPEDLRRAIEAILDDLARRKA